MDRPAIAHTFEVWLPPTMTWAYNQIRFVEGVEQTALALAEAGRERLSWEPKVVVAGPLERRWVGALSKAGRRVCPPSWSRALAGAHTDIVFSHFGYRGWRDVPLARRLGAVHLVRFYGHDVDMFPDRWPVWRRRYTELFAAADLMLCEGPAMAARLVERGCPAEKVEVLPLGVELERFPCRPRTVADDGVVKFLMAAAFRPKKGISLAIEAFALLHAAHPDTHLTIIGDAGRDIGERAEKTRIIAAVAAHRLEHAVTFLGFMPYARMIDEAYRHHIFLAPSVTAPDGDNEGGAPVTIIEMSATGMPVVGSTHRDIPNVVDDGVSGLLAVEGDVHGLAERMSDLTEHPERIPVMAAAARALVERRFDVRVCAGELEALYRRLLATADAHVPERPDSGSRDASGEGGRPC